MTSNEIGEEMAVVAISVDLEDNNEGDDPCPRRTEECVGYTIRDIVGGL